MLHFSLLASRFSLLDTSLSKCLGRFIRPIGTTLVLATILSGCTLREWIGVDPMKLELKDTIGFINHAIDYLAGFGALVTAFAMIAGYQFLMSAGSEEGQTRAKDTIRYSAVGMLIMVSGYALVKLIFTLLVNPAVSNPFS